MLPTFLPRLRLCTALKIRSSVNTAIQSLLTGVCVTNASLAVEQLCVWNVRGFMGPELMAEFLQQTFKPVPGIILGRSSVGRGSAFEGSAYQYCCSM